MPGVLVQRSKVGSRQAPRVSFKPWGQPQVIGPAKHAMAHATEHVQLLSTQGLESLSLPAPLYRPQFWTGSLTQSCGQQDPAQLAQQEHTFGIWYLHQLHCNGGEPGMRYADVTKHVQLKTLGQTPVIALLLVPLVATALGGQPRTLCTVTAHASKQGCMMCWPSVGSPEVMSITLLYI